MSVRLLHARLFSLTRTGYSKRAATSVANGLGIEELSFTHCKCRQLMLFRDDQSPSPRRRRGTRRLCVSRFPFAEKFSRAARQFRMDSGFRIRFTWSASVEKYVNHLKEKHEKMTIQLLDTQGLSQSEIMKITRDHQELSGIVEAYKRVLDCRKELLELAALAIEENDLKDMANEEAEACKERMASTQQELLQMLVPHDEDDDSSAILEVRAGTGGKEASLFTSEIFSLYHRYSSYKHWKFDTISVSVGDGGGLKEASAMISGRNVFRQMKYEVGVHRVQRVPLTESQGRIHTSTMTVAILPQPKEVQSTIQSKDLRIETFRASGAGGQHVNTTDSAVRITHIPTGLAVAVQEERSQLKNRAKAMKYLEAKLYDIERSKVDKERRETRRLQIGTGDRSERIRTYNFLQDRVTDHRVGLSLHGVEELLEGTEMFETLIEDLRSSDQILSLGKITDMPRVA